MKNLLILFLFLLPTFLICQQAEELFKIVEEMPRFPGCEQEGGDQESIRKCSNQKLIEYIYTNLKYPAEARKNEIEGVVVIQFVVDKDGSIRDAKIARDIGHGCGQAALDVVNSMANLKQRDTLITFNADTFEETVKVVTKEAKWKPGYQRGKAVNVLFTLPVKYKLEGEKKPDNTRITNTLKEPAIKDEWITHPPEYASFQQYKTQVLVPGLVKKTYVVEPIEKSKVVGDIIPYGETMHPLLKKMGSHNGIDFRAVPGVAVMATADGIVEVAETKHEKYGQYITIRHGERAVSLYAHMSDILVTKGQKIKAGQAIGAVGMSGKATYPHLHYEVIINNQNENPIQNRVNKVKLQRDDKLKPLYVIDEIVQESESNFKNLNPDDIKSVMVLKGDKAIDKYGAAGSNGVIEILLKSTLVQKAKEEMISDLKEQFELQQNYPNPVTDLTTIKFHLPTDRPASLHFYNQSGEFVHKITQGFSKGANEITISTTDLKTSGMIYYFLIQDHMTAANKMVVVK